MATPRSEDHITTIKDEKQDVRTTGRQSGVNSNVARSESTSKRVEKLYTHFMLAYADQEDNSTGPDADSQPGGITEAARVCRPVTVGNSSCTSVDYSNCFVSVPHNITL